MPDDKARVDFSDLGSLDMKPYMTVNEIAEWVGVSPLTVRTWAKKAGFTFTRGNLNTRYFNEEEVRTILKQASRMWFVVRGKEPPHL